MSAWRCNRGRWVSALAVACGLMITLAAGWVFTQRQPPAQTGRKVIFTVAQGESTKHIIGRLQRDGLVRNAYLFRVYLARTHQAQHLQAGQYQLSVGQNYATLAKSLQSSPLVSVRLTIPEGFTVQQIAKRLQQRKICSAIAFLDAEQNASLPSVARAFVPAREGVKYRLEGYLFPDTYEFARGESATVVVGQMVDDFAAHVQGPVLRQVNQQHRTLDSVVTEASLIEREAKLSSERPLIASVIHNRLKRHMRLAIDATVLYAIGSGQRVTVADTHIHDVYNTYLHKGLPPGPIASPGMASIRAALHPAHTHYLYYVAKNDGSGGSYFASTFAEQLRNEHRSEQNLKA